VEVMNRTKMFNLLIIMLFSVVAPLYAEQKIVEFGYQQHFGISADNEEWKFTGKTFSLVYDHLWLDWRSLIGKSKEMPVEFEFLYVGKSWNKWTRDHEPGIRPKDYLQKFFEWYNRCGEGGACGEKVYIEDQFFLHAQNSEEGKNSYLCRNVVVDREEGLGLCDVYLMWQVLDDEDLKKGYHPETYIMITKFNNTQNEMDEETREALGDQTRALITQISWDRLHYGPPEYEKLKR
jgi:hypothetical protein